MPEEILTTEYKFIYDVKCRRCGSVISMYAGSTPDFTEGTFHRYMNERSRSSTSGECDKCSEEGHTTICDYISWFKILK